MGSDHGEKGEIIMHGIEIQILEQKLDINNKMPKLKETEFLEQQTCKCGGGVPSAIANTAGRSQKVNMYIK